MPGKSGFELLKLLPGLESEIIFVTAHDNFALSAFSFSATGYILKPIDDRELSAAIDKALERIANKAVASQIRNPPAKFNDKIGVPKNHGIDYISVADILYLESVNKCTQIVTAGGKYTSSSNIGNFRYLVDDYSFFQVHRSYIVNLNCILRYESTGIVIMKDKKEIPVARNARHDFLQVVSKI
jgi:two-component system LytT family response regulator